MSKLGISTLVVGPAYGRDYKTAAEARKAWDENRDFTCLGLYQGVATSQADCYEAECNVQIRFNNLENVLFIPWEEMRDTKGVIPEWDEATFGPQDEATLAMNKYDIEAVMKHLDGGRP